MIYSWLVFHFSVIVMSQCLLTAVMVLEFHLDSLLIAEAFTVYEAISPLVTPKV